MVSANSIGIVGGSGALGSAIARGLLQNQFIEPGQLWVSNRSGNSPKFDEEPEIHFTTNNQELADNCQVILIAVPPHLASSVNINAENSLIISVMAGVSTQRIKQSTGARRVVRAMSSPAAELGLAYSPWCASVDLTDDDRYLTRSLFEAIGLTDELPNEDQIDHFTAMTGPVPGFVAYYADCMVGYATKHGIDPMIADRAIRQLFGAAGAVLAQSDTSPGEHVREMIAYAGTTAAGLEAMRTSPLAESIEKGLEAAYHRAQQIA